MTQPPADVPPPVPPLPPPDSDAFAIPSPQAKGLRLVAVFFWLLWGGLVMTLTSALTPAVLPLLVKDLGVKGLKLLTYSQSPYLLAFLIVPIISIWSDRHRGRRGRRIPFLLYCAPIIGGVLILFGVAGSLVPASQQLMVLIGLNFLLYLAMAFGNTPFWYLINDVVPERHLGKFFGFFHLVGVGGGFLFNYFLFDKCQEYYQVMFIGAGVLYVLGFGLMCFMIKEPAYPPPAPFVRGRRGFIGAVLSFIVECFCNRFYWLFYLTSIFSVIGAGVSIYSIFRSRSMGFSYQEIGTISAWSGIIGAILIVPAGWIVDWLHPVRVWVFAATVGVVISLLSCVFLFFDFTYSQNLTLSWIWLFALAPLGALSSASAAPLAMRVFPRSRYGQFSAALAMLRTPAAMLSSLAVGYGVDYVSKFLPADTVYRWCPLWTLFFSLLSVVFVWMFFEEWKRRGGAISFTPPIEQSPPKLDLMLSRP